MASRLLATYLVIVSGEDPEAFLRAMAAPLSAARRGEPLPGVPFSLEAAANAFVMLGLLPEPRAEEILAEYRLELEAKGFRFGVLTGELSVRPGAYGFQQAQAAGRDSLTRIPLAALAETVPIALDGMELSVTWATLTPGGVRVGYRVTGQLRQRHILASSAALSLVAWPADHREDPGCAGGNRQPGPGVPGAAGPRERYLAVRATGAAAAQMGRRDARRADARRRPGYR